MLAGGAIVTQPSATLPLAVVIVALTLCYLGGMYLNDAFDAVIDARERADRPIPRGDIDRRTVAWLGALMLILAVALLFAVSPAAGSAGVTLAATVVAYDAWHKRIRWAPLLMGGCRLLTYGVAALALTGGALDGETVPTALGWGALGLFCHVVGLTYAARQEAFDRLDAAWPLLVLAVPALLGGVFVFSAPEVSLLALGLWAGYLGWGGRCLLWLRRRARGDVPRAVVGLIAAISLFDATLMAALGAPILAMLALLAFIATLGLQRLASGT
ncbi:UbiA family prenyltransferase [Salinicola halophilus]|uniref:UbiA family prenyltransferase n=1 Tax=Salinicola halophilus TaxID=184065 RepID=UPI001EF7F6A5|nr:UbiA family prenyltransferase [Salinicola halophilus]